MITVYTKNHCPYCDMAKAHLTKNNIEFETVNITEDEHAREFIMYEGHRTMPQLYYNGKLFVEGGYHGLSKLTETEIKEKIDILTGNLGSL